MTNDAHSTKKEIAVYLGLGSNIGDRVANLSEAIARIEQLGLKVVSRSSIYETEPVGFKDQPWFLNQVIELKLPAETSRNRGPLIGETETIATNQAEALLSELLNIERSMGRERKVANGPRVIDIDLLLFGDKVIGYSKEHDEWPSIDQTKIVVPHPLMQERRFVLQPLCEIAPECMHPVLKKTCRELLAELSDD
jgi:7,8-dihydro-6-hydroxymethylpterin-pyrophosphokinase